LGINRESWYARVLLPFFPCGPPARVLCSSRKALVGRGVAHCSGASLFGCPASSSGSLFLIFFCSRSAAFSGGGGRGGGAFRAASVVPQQRAPSNTTAASPCGWPHRPWGAFCFSVPPGVLFGAPWPLNFGVWGGQGRREQKDVTPVGSWVGQGGAPRRFPKIRWRRAGRRFENKNTLLGQPDRLCILGRLLGSPVFSAQSFSLFFAWLRSGGGGHPWPFSGCPLQGLTWGTGTARSLWGVGGPFCFRVFFSAGGMGRGLWRPRPICARRRDHQSVGGEARSRWRLVRGADKLGAFSAVARRKAAPVAGGARFGPWAGRKRRGFFLDADGPPNNAGRGFAFPSRFGLSTPVQPTSSLPGKKTLYAPPTKGNWSLPVLYGKGHPKRPRTGAGHSG